MIELIIKATDAADLMAQLRLLLPAPAVAKEVPPTAVYAQEKEKPKKAPKAAVKAPAATPEPEEAPFEVEMPPVEPDVVDDVDDGDFAIVGGKAVDIAQLLKLKSDTISILQDAFAQGKVVKLRKLLMTHGDGAKSFPEVDPVKFIEISEAVKAGALNG